MNLVQGRHTVSGAAAEADIVAAVERQHFYEQSTSKGNEAPFLNLEGIQTALAMLSGHLGLS